MSDEIKYVGIVNDHDEFKNGDVFKVVGDVPNSYWEIFHKSNNDTKTVNFWIDYSKSTELFTTPLPEEFYLGGIRHFIIGCNDSEYLFIENDKIKRVNKEKVQIAMTQEQLAETFGSAKKKKKKKKKRCSVIDCTNPTKYDNTYCSSCIDKKQSSQLPNTSTNTPMPECKPAKEERKGYCCVNDTCLNARVIGFAHCEKHKFDMGNEPKDNPINPSHYQLFPDQPSWDIVEQTLTRQELIGFLKGTILKYRLRAGKKGPAEICIKKADWFEEKLVKLI